jgi:hypothetical protein
MKSKEKGYFFDPLTLHLCRGVASGVQESGGVMLAMREVKAIYQQGVYAVAAAFRQLYEVIEVEDERVHRRVAAATAAQLM